jgi:hypothetical protein
MSVLINPPMQRRLLLLLLLLLLRMLISRRIFLLFLLLPHPRLHFDAFHFLVRHCCNYVWLLLHTACAFCGEEAAAAAAAERRHFRTSP